MNQKSEKTQIIMHIDMDSFYASIEMANHPDLVGKPVVIGADPYQKRGVVSTCSYEAREFGLHSGMPISKAYQLCPQAIYLPVNMNLYHIVSKRIMSILKQYSDVYEQVSIDEAYLDISLTNTYISSISLATTIKNEIYLQEGLTCSIGIAPARYYAKMASEFSKPDGLTCIKPDDIRNFLENLSVSTIPGIGKRRFFLLENAGIKTIGDLAGTDIQILMSVFGNWGKMMQCIAQGLDTTGIHASQPRKSIGREITFITDTHDPEHIYQTLISLTTSVQNTLVASNFLCKTVTVKIRYADFFTQTRAISFSHETDQLQKILSVVLNLYHDLYSGDDIRLIGIRLSGFVQKNFIQTSIYDFIL